MKIFLMDIDKNMCSEWNERFSAYENVEVVNCEFTKFIQQHPEVDTIGSAANSFGLMDGGLDLYYIKQYGKDLQKAVQKVIIKEYYGEQPIGSSFILAIPNSSGIKLIHTPTMRVPMKITDIRVIYTSTRSALVEAIKAGSKVTMLPAYGHLTGGISADLVATMMLMAYKSVMDRLDDDTENTWDKCSRWIF